MPTRPRPLLLAVSLVALCFPALSAQNMARTEPPAPARDNSAHPEPTTGSAAHGPFVTSQYVLGTADVIHVNVWKSAELSQTVTVGPDGFVSLPLLGDIHVAGLTTSELAGQIASKMKEYVVNAQVSVSIVEIRSRQVFITGQVGKPGAYPLISPITVLQLIAQAGGLNTFANRKGIFVLRTATAQAQKLPFNYITALRGDMKQNVTLQPGDTVIIP